jgi:hypothetical protein
MGSMIREEVLPTLFNGVSEQYKDKVEEDDFSFFIAQDIVTALWEIDQTLSESPKALDRFHAIQGDMIDTLSFFIKQDPTRLEGEAQIFTNKLNKLLMELEL